MVEPKVTVKYHLKCSLCGRQGGWNPHGLTGEEGQSQE